MDQTAIPFHSQSFFFHNCAHVRKCYFRFKVWHYSEITFHLHVSTVFACVKHTGHTSSSSIGTTAYCGLRPVEQCPSIFSYVPPTLSIFSLSALEDLFLLPLSIISWVFPFFSSLPVLEWSFWASYPPPFSLGDPTSLSFDTGHTKPVIFGRRNVYNCCLKTNISIAISRRIH